jgi:hypothetical protein
MASGGCKISFTPFDSLVDGTRSKRIGIIEFIWQMVCMVSQRYIHSCQAKQPWIGQTSRSMGNWKGIDTELMMFQAFWFGSSLINRCRVRSFECCNSSLEKNSPFFRESNSVHQAFLGCPKEKPTFNRVYVFSHPKHTANYGNRTEGIGDWPLRSEQSKIWYHGNRLVSPFVKRAMNFHFQHHMAFQLAKRQTNWKKLSFNNLNSLAKPAHLA